MIIKKINPPRVFFPTKNSKLKDTLHIRVKTDDKININKKIKLKFEKWGMIIENNIHNDNTLQFMGNKIHDHLIWIKNIEKLKKYCKIENQKTLSIKKVIKKF